MDFGDFDDFNQDNNPFAGSNHYYSNGILNASSTLDTSHLFDGLGGSGVIHSQVNDDLLSSSQDIFSGGNDASFGTTAGNGSGLGDTGTVVGGVGSRREASFTGGGHIGGFASRTHTNDTWVTHENGNDSDITKKKHAVFPEDDDDENDQYVRQSSPLNPSTESLGSNFPPEVPAPSEIPSSINLNSSNNNYGFGKRQPTSTSSRNNYNNNNKVTESSKSTVKKNKNRINNKKSTSGFSYNLPRSVGSEEEDLDVPDSDIGENTEMSIGEQPTMYVNPALSLLQNRKTHRFSSGVIHGTVGGIEGSGGIITTEQEIKVCGFEIIRDFKNVKTVFYKIQLDLISSVVLRRYSDFASLRSFLIKFFQTKVIPPIPEKHSLGKLIKNPFNYKSDTHIIERRTRLLEFFLNELISDDEIRNSEILTKFLDPGEKNWSQLLNSPPFTLLSAKSILLTSPKDPTKPNPYISYLPLPPVGLLKKYNSDNQRF
ncbi:unnamed protein product [Ambrosiozyma monospora]|uniref:Unnamed protein product n=1 Tax=Ambrosiozyma monospora TaxID=43982 RepID=A0ACB5T646_AMBMO|nr:unnamed protein product [Ambrosiozyma monospora]